MFTPLFCAEDVHDMAAARRCDTRAYASFFHGMLQRGIYMPPSQFEVSFVSAAHTDAHVDAYVSAAAEVFAQGE
jgi:glutamate-1-semialdehyde 2,1-aminomutase